MVLDCDSLRHHFPLLRNGEIVYLDNAASTLKPFEVIDAMSEFASYSYANIHRGVYELSAKATRSYEDAHEAVAKFIGAKDWSEVVFTPGTTRGLHLASLLLYSNGVIKSGSEIIVSESDHHSNMLPWFAVARIAGARVRVIPADSNGIPRWDLIEDFLTEKTSVVSVGHVSNVTGYESPVKEIARLAHSIGAIVVVDGAQSVPHLPVNVGDLGIDMLAFSAHKMLGPTGLGVLWIRRDLAVEYKPPLGGGGAIKDVVLKGEKLSVVWDDPPWKFEPGTPPIIEAVGLHEAVKFLSKIGLNNIALHEQKLVSKTMKLLEELPNIRIIGYKDPRLRRGIVSFTYNEEDPDIIGLYLNTKKIAVRTGLHCAHPLHYKAGAHRGSVRVSFYLYNCDWEVEHLIDALKSYVRKSKKS